MQKQKVTEDWEKLITKKLKVTEDWEKLKYIPRHKYIPPPQKKRFTNFEAFKK